ncbi:MAG: putative nucleoside transporter YegT [Candidatus Hydrogenedentes bacterium ADurb.Bin179]|nr:MAG: putative nucleoside transporter YegT [Candidatus Hydrogenedentes bacterium ADurb.Bin179]
MMFLQYVVPGATTPILSLYLKDHLGFSASQAGVIMAMPAAAAIIAPLLASRVVDRWMSAARMLLFCHLAAGMVMLALYQVRSFPVFVSLFFVWGVCFAPTFGLTNAVALHHTTDARRDFGGIRLWGTMGWLAVAWAFGYFWMRGAPSGARLAHALPVSGLASLVLAAFALTLRASPAGSGPPARYGEVFRLFLRPEMFLLCVLNLLNGACHQFYYFGMSPYLSQTHFPDRFIMPGMSLGQLSEVIVLGLLGWFLARMSMKTAMLLGVAAQGLRMVMFAFAGNHAIVLAGISLHGFCYAFFFTAAYLYVESHSTRATRAGAQQLLTIMMSGAGTLAGFLAAGWTAQYLTHPVTGLTDYCSFWLVPAGLCAFIGLWLALGFHERPETGK